MGKKSAGQKAINSDIKVVENELNKPENVIRKINKDLTREENHKLDLLAQKAALELDYDKLNEE